MNASEMDTDAQFKEMTDQILADDANRILDRYIMRVDNWLNNQRLDGLEPTLCDLAKKMSREDAPKNALVVSLAAAIWRLREIQCRE